MRKSFIRFFLVLLGCVAVGIGFAPCLLAGSETPAIIISEAGYNFGELSETTPVLRDFIVKNGGGAVLDINDVRPS